MPLDAKSLTLRQKMLETLYRGGRGHLPSAFSCAEIMRVLYDSILNVNPAAPDDPGRDRFILSKGHACLALYVMLAEKGFFQEEELWRFCRFGSPLGGHPERAALPGIEASTGSLGHGPSLGVGLALAARMDKRPSRVFVLCGDGESNEGSVWEAVLSASKHKLENYTLIIDYNKMQSWDTTDQILPLEPYADKFRAFGFAVEELDGHDTAQLSLTLNRLPFKPGQPSVLIAHTVKGRGIRELEGDLSWHHKSRLSRAEYTSLTQSLMGK